MQVNLLISTVGAMTSCRPCQQQSQRGANFALGLSPISDPVVTAEPATQTHPYQSVSFVIRVSVCCLSKVLQSALIGADISFTDLAVIKLVI